MTNAEAIDALTALYNDLEDADWREAVGKATAALWRETYGTVDA